jgi:hypothetical protein
MKQNTKQRQTLSLFIILLLLFFIILTKIPLSYISFMSMVVLILSIAFITLTGKFVKKSAVVHFQLYYNLLQITNYNYIRNLRACILAIWSQFLFFGHKKKG